MSTKSSLVLHKSESLAILSPEEVTLFKRTLSTQYGDVVTDDDLRVFLAVCQKKRLDPIQKQIYIVPRWNSSKNRYDMSHQTSIDGYRAIAARTGQYAGNDDTIFDSELQPKKATTTVYRLVGGVRCPFTASARWDQYYPGDKLGFQWRKMPHVMLGKCSEGLALRKAFPEDLSDLPIAEEMAQADANAVTIQRSEVKPYQPTGSWVIDAGQGYNQATEAEIKAMDDHVSAVAKESHVESQGPSMIDRRTGILNLLIGKGKPFGSKVASAKDWVRAKIGAELMDLSPQQCESLRFMIEDAAENGEDLTGSKVTTKAEQIDLAPPPERKAGQEG